MKSPAKNHFGRALRQARHACQLSQEGFGDVSGRTYVSQIERGERQATLNKVDDLASVLAVHPCSLVLISYLSDRATPDSIDRLLAQVRSEAIRLLLPASESG